MCCRSVQHEQWAGSGGGGQEGPESGRQAGWPVHPAEGGDGAPAPDPHRQIAPREREAGQRQVQDPEPHQKRSVATATCLVLSCLDLLTCLVLSLNSEIEPFKSLELNERILLTHQETRRERPKSAPYLRLKNIQGTTIGKIWKKKFFQKKNFVFFSKKSIF